MTRRTFLFAAQPSTLGYPLSRAEHWELEQFVRDCERAIDGGLLPMPMRTAAGTRRLARQLRQALVGCGDWRR